MRNYQYIVLYAIQYRFIQKPAEEVVLCEEEAGLVWGINAGVEVAAGAAEEAILFIPAGITHGFHGDGGRLGQAWHRTLTWAADRSGGNLT